MSLIVTIPYGVTENDSDVCEYFASANPINIQCERKDFAVVDTQDDGSANTQINVTGTLPTLTVGGYVYVAAGTVTSGLYGRYAILSATASTIVIDLAFSGAYTGGFVNLLTDRPNYFIYTRIRAVNPTFPEPGGSVPYIYRKDYPNTLGVAIIDISENISAHFTPENEFDFDVVDEIDNNNCIQFSIEFKECWDNSLEAWSSAEYVNSVNAAMQVQNTGGSNMVRYITSGVNDAAYWLADVQTVRYWEGLPFDLQLLLYNADFKAYLDANPSLQLLRLEKQYTQVSDTPTVTATVLSNSGSLTIYDLYRRIMIAGSYSTDIQFVDVAIAYEYAPGLYQNLTNFIRIRVVHEEPCNIVFLTWLNKKGGWHYYCFSHRQQFGTKTVSQGEFTKSFQDLATQNTTSSLLAKNSENYMICGAEQLDISDSLLMASLIESPKVYLLMDSTTWDTATPVWREVKIDVGDYKTFDTKNTFNRIEFKVRREETFTQRN